MVDYEFLIGEYRITSLYSTKASVALLLTGLEVLLLLSLPPYFYNIVFKFVGILKCTRLLIDYQHCAQVSNSIHSQFVCFLKNSLPLYTTMYLLFIYINSNILILNDLSRLRINKHHHLTSKLRITNKILDRKHNISYFVGVQTIQARS